MDRPWRYGDTIGFLVIITCGPSQVSMLTPRQMVSELILQNVAAWNREKIQETFLAIDTEAILSIPLCTGQIDDFGHGILSGRACFPFVRHTECLWQLNYGVKRGWKNVQTLQIRRVRRNIGLVCGILRFRLRSKSSYGSLPNSLCPRLICSIIVARQRRQTMAYVVLKIPGDTIYWSATCLGVYGPLKTRTWWT